MRPTFTVGQQTLCSECMTEDERAAVQRAFGRLTQKWKLKACAHPECEPYRDVVGCILVCPMCGRPYADHPACTACDSPDHQIDDCPVVKAYDDEHAL